METYPEAPKTTTNKTRECVHCGDTVYARYLCRKHYNQQFRASKRQLKMEENRAKLEEKSLRIKPLQNKGEYCLVATCSIRTAHESKLCTTHLNRARNWKIAPEQLVSIFDKSECEICGSSENLVLDHVHGMDCEPTHRGSNGCLICFRGLLCSGCNSGIGFLGEDVLRLEKAANYLKTS